MATDMQLLLRVHSNTSRSRDISLKSLLRLAHLTTKRLPVKPQSRYRALNPVHHHQSDRICITGCLINLSQIMEFLHKPRQQTKRGVNRCISKCLRSILLLLRISTLVKLEVTANTQRLVLKLSIREDRQTPANICGWGRPKGRWRRREHLQMRGAY
jgi:hypothetical protein